MGINVLSLCDGISCAHIALDRGGVEVDSYFAAEIKDIAIKTTQKHYPDTIQIGDVNNIKYKDGFLYNNENKWKIDFDLVCFGSPCSSFSNAMKKEGRIGLEDKKRSGLYIECKRILDEIQPRYFFVENVGSMKKEDVNYLSSSLGVDPIRINSKIVAPALRDRYYWSNIPYSPLEEKESNFYDILDKGYSPRKKARAIIRSVGGGCHGYSDYIKMYRRVEEKGFSNLVYSSKDAYERCKEIYDTNFKGISSKEIDAIEKLHPEYQLYFKENIRLLSNNELEKCLTLPLGYTSHLTSHQAQDVIGDAWTVDVIVAWFKNIV